MGALRAQKAVDLIRNKAPDIGGPKCYYVGTWARHPAFVAGRKYWNLYPRDTVDMPNVPAQNLEWQHSRLQELRPCKPVVTPIPEQRIRNARNG